MSIAGHRGGKFASAGRSAWRVLIMLLALTSGLRDAARAGSPWGAGYIPNLPVQDQNGRALHFYDDLIKDKIVVVSFIYTKCKDICPLVTARLALLEEKLGDLAGRDVHFVSISIDPAYDTPERLKAHAEAFHTGAGWTFVTGAPDDIAQIRYKLGERSRELTEHRNEVMLGNDRTGQWARDSAFSDLVVLTSNVLNMDPVLRADGTAAAVLTAVAAPPPDEPGRILFTKTCASCHTLGRGDRIGPDLSGVLQRRERAWVQRYLAAPERVRGSQDPTARALSERYGAVRMPNLALSELDIADIMSFLDKHAGPGLANAAEPHNHRH